MNYFGYSIENGSFGVLADRTKLVEFTNILFSDYSLLFLTFETCEAVIECTNKMRELLQKQLTWLDDECCEITKIDTSFQSTHNVIMAQLPITYSVSPESHILFVPGAKKELWEMYSSYISSNLCTSDSYGKILCLLKYSVDIDTVIITGCDSDGNGCTLNFRCNSELSLPVEITKKFGLNKVTTVTSPQIINIVNPFNTSQVIITNTDISPPYPSSRKKMIIYVHHQPIESVDTNFSSLLRIVSSQSSSITEGLVVKYAKDLSNDLCSVKVVIQLARSFKKVEEINKCHNLTVALLVHKLPFMVDLIERGDQKYSEPITQLKEFLNYTKKKKKCDICQGNLMNRINFFHNQKAKKNGRVQFRPTDEGESTVGIHFRDPQISESFKISFLIGNDPLTLKKDLKQVFGPCCFLNFIIDNGGDCFLCVWPPSPKESKDLFLRCFSGIHWLNDYKELTIMFR